MASPSGDQRALLILFPFHGELRFLAALGRNREEVPDAAVVRYGGVAYAVKDGLSVGGKLGIGEPSEGE
jgi:hypothetical protein